MHDLLFENQSALEDEDLVAYAGELSLDETRLIREVTVERLRTPDSRGFQERRERRRKRDADILYQWRALRWAA